VNSPKSRYRGAKLQNQIMAWLVKTSAKPSRKSPVKIIQSKKTLSKKAVYKKPVAQKTTVKNVFSELKTTAPLQSRQAGSSFPQKYYVQVGSFSSVPNKKYLNDIKNSGLSYKVLRGKSYKVLVGPYENEKNARKVLARVQKNLNKKAFISTF
jgi:cell division protein FtsN